MHRSRQFEPDQFSGWLSQLELECRRILVRGGRPRADHDDIVSIIMAKAWESGPDLMDAYVSASTYAGVRTPHAAESFYRTNRAQRGEGARLRRTSDGDVVAGRTVVSIDAGSHGGSHGVATSTLVAGPEESVVEAIRTADSIRDVLRALDGVVTDDDVADFVLVHAFGLTVGEVARRRGVTRETASRRISRVRRAIEHHSTGFTAPV